MIRKWNIVNDKSNANYNLGIKIIYSTEVLKTILCHYNDAYILVGCDIANMFEYSSNYSDATGNLQVYSKDKATRFNADIADNNTFKYFK